MERIQKLLAAAGVASRRNVEQMIREGRVAVNGAVTMQLPILVDPHRDRITVDGARVNIAPEETGPRIYLLLNKPKNVYSTNAAQGEQLRAVDLLPRDLPARVYPVGRLEADARGLMLFTNDGELTHRLTHPRFGIARTYRAVVHGSISPQAMQQISNAVRRTGDPARGAKTFVKAVKRSRDMTILELTLREGRNSEIRRIFAKAGYKLRELTRIKMGPLTLEGLAPGEFRSLTSAEIKRLRGITSKSDSDSELE